jgi:membrane associated rhomboid family serine protease
MIPIHDDNPTRRVPVVTLALPLSCTLVLLWELNTPIAYERRLHDLGVTPAVLFGKQVHPAHSRLVPPWLSVLTSMFMHGAYLILYPRARVLVIIPIFFFIQAVWWPAWVVLTSGFALQIFSSLLTAGAQGGVAWGAHIGGFSAGMLLIVLVTGGRRRHWR